MKLGFGVYATYRAVGSTCPSGCAFLNKGCYAQHGNVGIHEKRGVYSPEDGRAYYDWVKNLPRFAKVRLHVSGDFLYQDKPDYDYIDWVLKAHTDYPNEAWTYTHAWKQLDARLMNSVPALTVNASCDTPIDATIATAAGWPITVSEYMDGVTCPAQTEAKLICSECMICFRKGHKPVRFIIHGTKKAAARMSIKELMK